MNRRNRESSSNKIIILLVVSLAVAVIWYFSLEQDMDAAGFVDASGATADKVAASSALEQRDDLADNSGDSVDELKLRQNINKWYQARGYYMDLDSPSGSVPRTHTYDALDDDALGQLVEGGDAIAATMLGDRFIASLDEKTVEKGLQMHREAVTLGSTYSSVMLGNVHLGHKATGEPVEDLKEVTEGLAWMLFSVSRDDPAGSLRYNEYMQSKSIDPSLILGICDRARELEAEVNSERIRRGLAKLSNEPFPEIPDTYDDSQSTPVTACD